MVTRVGEEILDGLHLGAGCRVDQDGEFLNTLLGDVPLDIVIEDGLVVLESDLLFHGPVDGVFHLFRRNLRYLDEPDIDF